jgi:hypothetical protein
MQMGSPRTTAWVATSVAVALLVLPTAATARGQTTTHRFAPAADVTVSFSLTKHRARGTMLRFSANRVSLVRTRSGRLRLQRGQRHSRRVVAPRHRRTRVVTTLSVSLRTVTLSVGRKSVHLSGSFVPERAVTVRKRLVVGFRMATRAMAAPAVQAPAPAAPAAPAAPPRLFAPDSVWNAPLAPNTPVDPASATIVKTLRDTVTQNMTAGWGPWIETTRTSPLYIVPADQRTVRVALDPGSWKAGLQRTFEAVPIPPNSAPAASSDAHMTIWQPSTDRLWEMWLARREADGWHASFGGAMSNVSGSPGYFDTNSWPGLSQSWWGATATSLPAIAGTMTISELQSGVIPHALAMVIPTARAKTYAFPAQRTDGTDTSAASIPEGARFRLDPTLDLAKLNLPRVTRAMAVAAQRYGMIVTDVTHHAVSVAAENPALSPRNPYPALFGGPYPNAVMNAFPWDHLQLVKMVLRTMR